MTQIQKSTAPAHHLRAEGMLLVMTFLWGSTFAATKWAVDDMPPLQLLGVRFAVATVISILVWPKVFRFRGDGQRWAGACWLGLLLWLGYWMQAEGLKTTTAGRSGFITALSVPLVPVFQIFILKRLPALEAVVGIAVALVGTALLCTPDQGVIVVGDIWTLGCALAWGFYIIELSRLSKRIGLPHMLVGQCLVALVLCWGLAPWLNDGLVWDLSAKHWGVLFYLGAFCTFLGALIMCRYQPQTTPTRAALIYAAEPVFAASIAWVVLSEEMGGKEFVGAGLILLGILCAEVVDWKWVKSRIRSG